MTLTPAERRARALAEVHQHRPANEIAVTTLQFDHPAFDAPARVVADNAPLEARLESGELVIFEAVAFRATGPAQGESRWPEVALEIDGASQILEPHLEASLTLDAPIAVTVREYVRSRANEGPGRVITGLELNSTDSSDLTVRGTAGIYGLDRTFGRRYDPSTYPGLS